MLSSLKIVKTYDKERVHTSLPCIFCGQGYMRVWKNSKGDKPYTKGESFTFHCSDNPDCRYAFTVDSTGKVLDIDGFGPPDSVFSKYAKKVKIGSTYFGNNVGVKGILLELGYSKSSINKLTNGLT